MYNFVCYTYNVMSANLLLISNSTVFGRGYLDHVAEEVVSTLGRARMVLFFPFALHEMDSYAAKAAARFLALGYRLASVHAIDAKKRRGTVDQAAALLIGGGNTFRLLNALYRDDLLDVIRAKVSSGIPFIGSSAGSIVAGPTIKTTKDMPILQPPSFDSLG